MVRQNIKQIFDMTVTTFLLILLTFVGGCALGAALYQWNLIKKIKSGIKSLEGEVKDRMDYHEVPLQDGKKLIVSKSLIYENQYVVTIENSSKTEMVYFDADPLDLTLHGTVDN